MPGQQPRACIDAVEGEHAGRSMEATVDQHGGICLPQGLDGRPRAIVAEPEGDAVIFRLAAFDPDQLRQPLAQGGDAVVLRAGDDDQPAGPGARHRLGDVELVAAAMAACQHQRDSVAFTFRAGPYRNVGRLQRAEMRPEALHRLDGRAPARGQAEARLGTKEEDTVFVRRQDKRASLEGIKKGPERF